MSVQLALALGVLPAAIRELADADVATIVELLEERSR